MDDTVSDETNRNLVQISDLQHIVKSHRTANINYLSQVIPILLPDSLKHCHNVALSTVSYKSIKILLVLQVGLEIKS